MQGSIVDLVKVLKGDLKTLLQEEFLLIKAEMTERFSPVRAEASTLAISLSAAAAGAAVFLIAICFLVSWAFRVAGLPPLLAGCVGFGIIGLILACTGGLLLVNALHKLSEHRFVPKKSIETLQNLKEGYARPADMHAAEASFAPKEIEASHDLPEAKLSSDELQALAFSTERSLGKTLTAIEKKISPHEKKEQIKRGLREHPYRTGAGALAAAVLTSLLVWRKVRTA